MQFPASAAAVAVISAGLAFGAGIPVVHSRSELARSAANAPAHELLNRFAAAFRSELARRAQAPVFRNWEYWVVLRPDPNRSGNAHVLVVGRTGRWLGRVSEFAVLPGLNVAAEATRAASISLSMTGPARGRPPIRHEVASATR